MTESQEFKAWLRKNHSYLRSCTPDEVAYFAIQNGFSTAQIYGGTSEWVTHIKRLLTFWESPFSEQWMILCSIQRGTDE